MSSCLLAYTLLISGPACAFLYAVSVWITFAVNKECRWGSKTTSLLLRLGLIVATIACSIGLCHSDRVHLSAILPIGGFFWLAAMFLMYQTRQEDVVGINQAPYYGAQHLKGKVALITGANNGIGKETTIQLARMGVSVYMLCRSEARAKKAREDILKSYPEIVETQLTIITMDLGDFQAVRNAVQKIEEHKVSAVDILINNAGLMMGTQTKSKDGYELMMQANHLGHFFLTRLLMDKKLFLKDSRILNLTSSTYEMTQSGFDFDDMFCEKGRPYSLFTQYSMSKLANVLCTKELSRRLEQAIFAVHPGIVRTNVTSNMQWYWRVPNTTFAWFVASMQKTPEQGAYSSVFCAAAPADQLPPSGSYIVNCKPIPTIKCADSPEDAKRLWEVSERLVGLKE